MTTKIVTRKSDPCNHSPVDYHVASVKAIYEQDTTFRIANLKRELRHAQRVLKAETRVIQALYAYNKLANRDGYTSLDITSVVTTR